jgi:hypothetical protein
MAQMQWVEHGLKFVTVTFRGIKSARPIDYHPNAIASARLQWTIVIEVKVMETNRLFALRFRDAVKNQHQKLLKIAR